MDKLKLAFTGKWSKNNCSDSSVSIKQSNKTGDNSLRFDQSRHNVVNNNYAGPVLSGGDFSTLSADLGHDLDVLYDFLIYGRGDFCPSRGEARAVILAMYEGEADYSYAERGQQFFEVGQSAIGKCRKLLAGGCLKEPAQQAVKKFWTFLLISKLVKKII